MKEPVKKIEIGVWKRYETYDFEIAPSLAGAYHQFRHKNYNIKVQLPQKPKQKDWHNENSRVTCSGYRDRKYRKYPISYSIHSVDVTVETMLSRKIKREALERVNVSLFSNTERQKLDKITYEFENIIEDAFDNWINIMRWKSGIYTLCQFRYNRQKSAWGIYLFNSTTQKNFYTPGHVIAVNRRPL